MVEGERGVAAVVAGEVVVLVVVHVVVVVRAVFTLHTHTHSAFEYAIFIS